MYVSQIVWVSAETSVEKCDLVHWAILENISGSVGFIFLVRSLKEQVKVSHQLLFTLLAEEFSVQSEYFVNNTF